MFIYNQSSVNYKRVDNLNENNSNKKSFDGNKSKIVRNKKKFKSKKKSQKET